MERDARNIHSTMNAQPNLRILQSAFCPYSPRRGSVGPTMKRSKTDDNNDQRITPQFQQRLRLHWGSRCSAYVKPLSTERAAKGSSRTPKKNQNLARRLTVMTRKGKGEHTIRPCTLRNRLPKCYLEQNPLRDIVYQGLPSDMMGAFS